MCSELGKGATSEWRSISSELLMCGIFVMCCMQWCMSVSVVL